MKSDMREKVAKSLTAESTALLPYLPYLLQDLWELGSSPDEIVSAIKNCGIDKGWRVLDLGCGKGAVSIRLARNFGCSVKGIDFINDFIDYARKKRKSWAWVHCAGLKQAISTAPLKAKRDMTSPFWAR